MWGVRGIGGEIDGLDPSIGFVYENGFPSLVFIVHWIVNDICKTSK